MLTKEDKEKIIQKFRLHSKDTGSAPVQIAILTARINYLSEHLKIHKKDIHSRRGLIMLVEKRRSLLKYLSKKDPTTYENIIKELKIRK